MRVSDVCGARAAASARGRLRLTAYVNVAGCQLPYYVGKAELVQVPTSYPYLLRTLTHIIVTYFMLFPHVSLKFICHRVVNSPAVVVDSTFLINFDINMGQNNHTKYLPTFSTSLIASFIKCNYQSIFIWVHYLLCRLVNLLFIQRKF